MSYRTRFKYIVIALQRVGTDNYGEDYIVNGAPAVTLQTSDAEISPFEGDEIERNLDDGSTGSSQVMLDGHTVKITCKVEVAGAGTVDLPVPYSPLTQICGRDEVITATTDVSHSRITDGSELDATVYFYKDGALHKALGCRASRKVMIKTGELPYYEFEITGLYGGIVTNNFAKPVLPTYQKVSKAGIATKFLLDGNSYELVSLEFNDGNTVEYSETLGGEKIDITDFKPDGSLSMEMPPLGNFDPFAIADAETLMPIEVIQGLVAGNKVKIASTSIQFGRPSYEDIKGITGYKIPFKLIDDVVDTTF